MDKLSELSHGAKVVLGAAIALLIFSFFNWFEVKNTSYGESMWHGIGFLAGLLVIVLIVWQAIRLANINIEIGVTPSMITAALAVLLLIFTFIRFIAKPGGGFADAFVDRTIWAWIGLVLAIVICVGAWMNMRAAGEGLGDVKTKLSTMTSSAKSGGDTSATTQTPTPTPTTPEPPAGESSGGGDEPAA